MIDLEELSAFTMAAAFLLGLIVGSVCTAAFFVNVWLGCVTLMVVVAVIAWKVWK